MQILQVMPSEFKYLSLCVRKVLIIFLKLKITITIYVRMRNRKVYRLAKNLKKQEK